MDNDFDFGNLWVLSLNINSVTIFLFKVNVCYPCQHGRGNGIVAMVGVTLRRTSISMMGVKVRTEFQLNRVKMWFIETYIKHV